MVEDAEDKRLAIYFLNRAVELLEAARIENDPLRRLDLEQRVLHYWQASRTAQRH